jgi:hypothetical protein
LPFFSMPVTEAWPISPVRATCVETQKRRKIREMLEFLDLSEGPPTIQSTMRLRPMTYQGERWRSRHNNVNAAVGQTMQHWRWRAIFLPPSPSALGAPCRSIRRGAFFCRTMLALGTVAVELERAQGGSVHVWLDPASSPSSRRSVAPARATAM